MHPYAVQPDWGAGLGSLRIYVQDMNRPLLIVPVELGSLLRLPGGRAWVGFTAATDAAVWQVRGGTACRRSGAKRCRRAPPLTPHSQRPGP